VEGQREMGCRNIIHYARRPRQWRFLDCIEKDTM
jgi:hypothetical protein